MKTSKLICAFDESWEKVLCNACYGSLLATWDVKNGALSEDARDIELVAILERSVTRESLALARTALIAAGPGYQLLSADAQRMLATSHALVSTLRLATDLDWSAAVIGLCKAVEIELVGRVAEPLRAATVALDLSPDLADQQFKRIAQYCTGAGKAPEIGSLAYFLRTAANSTTRAATSPLIAALRDLTAKWPAADWLFAEDGFSQEAQRLTRDFRNPAAHTAVLSERDFEECAILVEAQDGLLWRLLVSTGRQRPG